jgi:hypothetical protein
MRLLTSNGGVVVGLRLGEQITEGLDTSTASCLDPTPALRLEAEITH